MPKPKLDDTEKEILRGFESFFWLEFAIRNAYLCHPQEMEELRQLVDEITHYVADNSNSKKVFEIKSIFPPFYDGEGGLASVVQTVIQICERYNNPKKIVTENNFSTLIQNATIRFASQIHEVRHRLNKYTNYFLLDLLQPISRQRVEALFLHWERLQSKDYRQKHNLVGNFGSNMNLVHGVDDKGIPFTGMVDFQYFEENEFPGIRRSSYLEFFCSREHRILIDEQRVRKKVVITIDVQNEFPSFHDISKELEIRYAQFENYARHRLQNHFFDFDYKSKNNMELSISSWKRVFRLLMKLDEQEEEQEILKESSLPNRTKKTNIANNNTANIPPEPMFKSSVNEDYLFNSKKRIVRGASDISPIFRGLLFWDLTQLEKEDEDHALNMMLSLTENLNEESENSFIKGRYEKVNELIRNYSAEILPWK